MSVLLKRAVMQATAFVWMVSVVSAQSGWVRLQTNQMDATLYADTTWLGTAETSVFKIPRGAERLILVSRSVDAWSIPSLTADLEGLETDTLNVRLDFPYYYRLETVPSEATVYLFDGDARLHLGETPLDYSSSEELSGEFIFEKDSYVTRQVTPGSELWNRHLVLLESELQRDPVITAGIVAEKRSTAWIDYVAAGTAIVGGLLAVHYKTKADKLYDEFTESRDFALKPDIDQFDLYSGVALGAMQAGLGVLAFRLIF